MPAASTKSLSADDRRAHGLAPSFWAFDEFAQAPNSDLLDSLRTAWASAARALGIIISTQASNDMHPLSQFIDDAALGEDPSVYLQLAAAPTDADIFDEKVWFACNEALGKFLDLNEFRAQAEQAKRLPSLRAKFQQLRLNQRIDARVQFISDADWMQCAAPLDMWALAGKPVYGGLDLSQTTDMSALVLYWPHDGSVLPFFWLPEEGLLDRDRKEGGHYRTWRDAGLLETTPGKAINFRAIIKRLAEIASTYDLRLCRLRSCLHQELQRQMRGGRRTLAAQGVWPGLRFDEPGRAGAGGRHSRSPHPSCRSSDLAVADVECRDRDRFVRQSQTEQEARHRSYRRRR